MTALATWQNIPEEHEPSYGVQVKMQPVTLITTLAMEGNIGLGYR